MSRERELLHSALDVLTANPAYGKRRGAGAAIDNALISNLVDDIRANLAEPLPEPDAFIVLDPAGDHVYSSPHKQFCHDHINDLLMRDIGVNDSFVVRGFYAEPQVSKHEESYSDALRSLASYVGCGGYNADDPIDAKEFEEKIRLGIDLLLSAESQSCARKPFTDFC